MAADLWPDPTSGGGTVANIEHEQLFAFLADGVLPGQASNAFAVSVVSASRAWTVQAGRFMVRGHVLSLSAAATGTLTANVGANRNDSIVAYIDRTTTPWTFGVRAGTAASGGSYTPVKSATGVWETVLAQITVTTTGATLIASPVPFLSLMDGYPGTDTGWVNCQTYTAQYWSVATTPQVRRIGQTTWLQGVVRKQSSQLVAGIVNSVTCFSVPAAFAPGASFDCHVYAGAGGDGILTVDQTGALTYYGNADLPVNSGVNVAASWPTVRP